MSKILHLFILSAFAALPLLAEETEDTDKKPQEEQIISYETEESQVTEEPAEEVAAEESTLSFSKKPTGEMKDSPKEDRLFNSNIVQKASDELKDFGISKDNKLFATSTEKPSEDARNENPSEKLFI